MTAEQREGRVYSPSQLILADACPAAWAAEKLYGEAPTDESYPLDYGSLFHKIIARYNKYCRNKGRRTADLERMGEIIDIEFGSEDRSVLIPDGDYGGMSSLCMRTAERQKLDLKHLVDVEHTWYMTVDGYRFRGRPDLVLVDGHKATIPDYKTSRTIKTDAHVGEDFKSQCYAALIMDEENCPQVKVAKVAMDFARYGHTSSFTFMPHHVERVRADIRMRIQRLEAREEFPETPCDWCGLCRRRSVCEALTHAIAGAGNMVKVVARQDQAEFILGEIKLFGVALDNRKKKLAEYAVHTPVEVNGMGYGPREHRSRVYDADELYKAYDGTESGPFAMLSANGDAIRYERERKKKHEPDVDLETLGHGVVKTKMELYKVPKPAPKEVSDATG